MSNFLSDCCGAGDWNDAGICEDCREHCDFVDYDEEQGDLEEFRDIKGFEGIYQVSDHGNIRSVDRVNHQGKKYKGVDLKSIVTQIGYGAVNLHKEGVGDLGFSINNNWYYSSSETSATHVWIRLFEAEGTSRDEANSKVYTLYVRAVRAF